MYSVIGIISSKVCVTNDWENIRYWYVNLPDKAGTDTKLKPK